MHNVKLSIGHVAASLIVAGVAQWGAGAAQAQDRYPDRPIRLVVPFSPGGQTDNVSRRVGDAISPILGEQVIVVVERPVGHDVHLGAGEDAEAPAAGVPLPHLLDSALELSGRHVVYVIAGTLVADIGAFLLRDGSPIVDQSRVWSLQFQHGFDGFGGRQAITYGADFIRTDARTSRTINGSNEDNDTIDEYGGYLHGVTRLTPRLDLVAALRVDKHSWLASAVWSPRIGLVYKPSESQALRVTFNRAFATPTNNNLFLDIIAGRIEFPGGLGYDVRALGVDFFAASAEVGAGTTSKPTPAAASASP